MHQLIVTITVVRNLRASLFSYYFYINLEVACLNNDRLKRFGEANYPFVSNRTIAGWMYIASIECNMTWLCINGCIEFISKRKTSWFYKKQFRNFTNLEVFFHVSEVAPIHPLKFKSLCINSFVFIFSILLPIHCFVSINHREE